MTGVVTSNRQRRAVAVVGSLAAVAAGLITTAVALRAPFLVRLDSRIGDDALGAVHAHVVLLDLARAVTQLGNPVVVDIAVGVIAIAAVAHRRWRLAVAVVVARLISLAVEHLVKSAVDRPRPQPLQPVAHANGPGFPSGHSTGVAMVAAVLLIALWTRPAGEDRHSDAGRRLRWCATVLLVIVAMMVAASRVLLGVHYPSDVVGGLFIGGSAACFAVWIAACRQRA